MCKCNISYCACDTDTALHADASKQVISLCKRRGKTVEALAVFADMKETSKPSPDIVTYTTLMTVMR